MPKARPADARQAPDVRICRLHELAVRDETGHSRAFRFGERVEMTPSLEDALGAFVESFARLDAAPLDPQALTQTTTSASGPTVTLPTPEAVTALVDPAHEE